MISMSTTTPSADAATPNAPQTYTCANCGATTSFDPGAKTLRCPFCGSEVAVRATAAAATVTVAQYVLPFKLDKDASGNKVREWLGSSFFAPGDLKSRSAFERSQGTYIPFWRFDADAASNWEGEISETHTRQVQRQFTNDSGQTETRMVSEEYKTWHPRSGSHQGHHRTFVPGSQGLTQSEADQLMPFPEEGMMTYSDDLLVGFAAEEPGIDEAGAWSSGETRIRSMERDACAKEVERLTRAETTLSNRQTAVCYLPVWLYNYRYKNEAYRVLVNGFTGEVVGHRPVSRVKVILTVAVVALIVIAIIVAIALTR
jgi:DNA-directed RNA polymerase subunit RPC12/RpoP